MKIADILELIEAKVANSEICLERTEKFKYAFASDLMSDVLRLKCDNTLLVTGLCNIQTIRTVEMAEIKLIIIARGKKIDDEMLELADENDICVLETEFSVYKVCGLLYQKGILPVY
ncbi:MAG: DRTGG domain-containing protein [Bacteroidales bacterium]|jgi:predicted transcriptional regulator|nr:DRTGG domain-containing protein [Bacteroidales bacterium]MCK9499032.1 DRTGG domain-containing protein [Bacteroidales bacterium]MDY0313955.1 DRTGG domain-containing protein [Bacteroidales bacterium]